MSMKNIYLTLFLNTFFLVGCLNPQRSSTEGTEVWDDSYEDEIDEDDKDIGDREEINGHDNGIHRHYWDGDHHDSEESIIDDSPDDVLNGTSYDHDDMENDDD